MEYFESLIAGWLTPMGAEGYAGIILEILTAITVVIVCLIVNKLTQVILYAIVHKAVAKSSTPWDDILLEKGFFSRISKIAPVAVVYLAAPLIPDVRVIVEHAALASLGLIAMLAAGALLDSADAIYQGFESSKNRADSRVPPGG